MIKGAYFSSITSASPAAIWPHYEDVVHWPRWDHAMASSWLDGAFVPGTKGGMKAKMGLVSHFVIVSVKPEREYTTKSTLPGSTMYIRHEITPLSDNRTKLTHQLSFEGPLGGLWSRLFDTKLLTGGVRGVIALAEKQGE